MKKTRIRYLFSGMSECLSVGLATPSPSACLRLSSETAGIAPYAHHTSILTLRRGGGGSRKVHAFRQHPGEIQLIHKSLVLPRRVASASMLSSFMCHIYSSVLRVRSLMVANGLGLIFRRTGDNGIPAALRWVREYALR